MRPLALFDSATDLGGQSKGTPGESRSILLSLTPEVLNRMEARVQLYRSLNADMPDVRSLVLNVAADVRMPPGPTRPEHRTPAHDLFHEATHSEGGLLVVESQLDPTVLHRVHVAEASAVIGPSSFWLHASVGPEGRHRISSGPMKLSLLTRARLALAEEALIPELFSRYAAEAPEEALSILEGQPAVALDPPSHFFLTRHLSPEALVPLLEAPTPEVRERAIRAMSALPRHGRHGAHV